MAREKLMTWVKIRKGWMKMYRGKTYSVSCKQLNCPPTEAASWMIANGWWEVKQKEIDALDGIKTSVHPHQTLIDELAVKLEWAQKNGAEDEARRLSEQLTSAQKLTEADDTPQEDFTNTIKIAEQFGITIPEDTDPMVIKGLFGDVALWNDRISRSKTLAKSPNKSAQYQVDEWVGLLRASVNVGQMSAGRWESYRLDVGKFVTYFGADRSIADISADTVQAYFSHLALRVHEEKISIATAKKVWMTFKQWANWLAEKGLIAVPGNLRSKRLRFTDVATTPKTVSVEDVQTLLGRANDRTKLFILLMLNCGMYQSDIASLKQSEVDWKEGTITRRRSKTEKIGGQVIKYKLWKETFRLLTQLRSKDKDLALTSEQGKPLTMGEVSGDGKYKRYDCIRESFQKVVRATGLEVKIKEFRKTGASKLAEHTQYKYYAVHYLAQSPKHVSDKSYVIPSEAEFFAALSWLEKELLG